jgi:hypothetical protein
MDFYRGSARRGHQQHPSIEFLHAECCPIPLVVFLECSRGHYGSKLSWNGQLHRLNDSATSPHNKQKQTKSIQAARYDENTHKPESKFYTDDNNTTQLKMALRVLSFSRVEL